MFTLDGTEDLEKCPENLFTILKIELFSMPEVIECKNQELKAKLRKVQSKEEAEEILEEIRNANSIP